MASDPARAGSGGAQSDSDPEDSPPRPGGRRGTRREKNRVAAQKSRQKQTQRADILHQESETLEQENAALRREIESLRVELHSLDALLRQHEARCYHGSGGGGPSTGVLAGGGPAPPPETNGPIFAAAQALHGTTFSVRGPMVAAAATASSSGAVNAAFPLQPNGDFKFPYGS
ncbi:basic leucine zipper transcriptional factor ATF-like isoform X2 [Lethenteron reissneri]|uniref:basic leucine zipper transcriptional factor ATF-like isoform X2 n=1 Tax=Lethenteron reissneri TaxID=7753 RepID=UPI002AB72CF9|nr:basic leucine zipper transcriptional factor ATF-like isoform X2 [Lethenteron reissneri]